VALARAGAEDPGTSPVGHGPPRPTRAMGSPRRVLEDAAEALGEMYDQGWADVRAVQAGYLRLARRLR
jgi:hypothetical protein